MSIDKEKLKEELLKSIKITGFPLELAVGKIFLDRAWNTSHSEYYIDKEDGRAKEIDICAYNHIFDRENNISVGLHLICEIKNTEGRPWVVFSTNKQKFEGGGWRRLHYQRGIDSKILSGTSIDNNSTFMEFKRLGRTYHEGFKSENDDSRIFKALISSIKAAEDCLEDNKEAMDKLCLSPKDKEIIFLDPIIVISGFLFEAFLNEQETIELNEIKHIIVYSDYNSPKYHEHQCIIDIVTIDELPNLLTKKERWINGIYKEILKNKTSA